MYCSLELLLFVSIRFQHAHPYFKRKLNLEKSFAGVEQKGADFCIIKPFIIRQGFSLFMNLSSTHCCRNPSIPMMQVSISLDNGLIIASSQGMARMLANRCASRKMLRPSPVGCYDNKLWFLVVQLALFRLCCGMALSSLVKHEVGLSELNVTRVLWLLVFVPTAQRIHIAYFGLHISIMHWRLWPNWNRPDQNSPSNNLLNFVVVILVD